MCSQVIQEIKGGLEGWRTGGRYQEMGILEHVRPNMHIALLSRRFGVIDTLRLIMPAHAWLQVANKDYRWAY